MPYSFGGMAVKAYVLSLAGEMDFKRYEDVIDFLGEVRKQLIVEMLQKRRKNTAK